MKCSVNGTILLATVKGDVHDIGKNIAGVVLQCNNYKIIDLGVMVPRETILETAEREKVDLIGLSGLITPSLEEMTAIAGELERRGMKIPLLLGGATTSQAHTALKVAPAYPSGVVIQVHDASQGVLAVNSILNPKTGPAYRREIQSEYEKIRMEADLKASRMETLSLSEARGNALKTDWNITCGEPGRFREVADFPEIELPEVAARIDWKEFHRIWKDTPGGSSELRQDADKILRKMMESQAVGISASMGFFPAFSRNDNFYFHTVHGLECFPMLRQQFRKYPGQPNLSLADYFPPENGPQAWGGCFAVGCTVGEDFLQSFGSDDYSTLLVKTLADRLAEAGASLLQDYAVKDWKGTDSRPVVIRPAPGYPAVPDHALKADIFRILEVERKYGFRLTDSYMMIPAASVCGFLIVHPAAQYFAVGRIGEDQLADYAERRGGRPQDIVRFIAWQE